MEKYFEINEEGHNIRCKIYFNKGEISKKVIIYVHGFAGHKDNTFASKFAERVLTKYKNVSLIVFDLPCHGNDVKKKLTLDYCDAYIRLVVKYAEDELGAEKIYNYSTSFGGYLILRYISKYGNPFNKTVLRCPALNMYDSLTEKIMTEDDRMKTGKGKNALVGFDRKVEIGNQFLEELKNNDIMNVDFVDFSEDISIIHGTADEIIPFDLVRKFSDDNIIDFIPAEGADHRFRNPVNAEFATKKVLEFFAL